MSTPGLLAERADWPSTIQSSASLWNVGMVAESNDLGRQDAIRRPVSIVPALQTAIREVDQSIPLAEVDAMATIVDRSMAQLSFAMVLLAIAAGDGAAARAVRTLWRDLLPRKPATGEIGIRMALGAEPRQVARLVVAVR